MFSIVLSGVYNILNWLCSFFDIFVLPKIGCVIFNCDADWSYSFFFFVSSRLVNFI